jgi:hypothetical protein
MNQDFLDYYRCPTEYADFRPATPSNGNPFPPSACLRQSATANDQSPNGNPSVAVLRNADINDFSWLLPFDLTDVVTNIRYERYVEKKETPFWKRMVRQAYYCARPLMPVPVRRHLQRAWLKGWDSRLFPAWPVDSTVDKLFEQTMALSLRAAGTTRVPFIWFWPEGHSACAVMTHDVETEAGLQFCSTLMDIDDAYGVKCSFQIIPQSRYNASKEFLDTMRARGFEINVHDLRHDGHLFRQPEKFSERAEQINRYTVEFGSKGFRSGVLYRNLEWYEAFKFSYDMSVPNVGHLDPQPGGCCTVMPYYVGNILELPVTTTQDYSLFNILNSYSIELWQQQIELIRQRHGFISFIVHPDYLNTVRARSTYHKLLRELAELRSTAGVWLPTPGEVDTWWRQRSQLRLVTNGSGWRIEGPGAERARIAYAELAGDGVVYSLN